jgi:hypothetical protein
VDDNSSYQNAGKRDEKGVLNGMVYVVAEQAKCLYQPSPRSAVRIIPPYGTKVSVIRDAGDWVLISFCDKEAWSPRENLSARREARRPAIDVGIVPPPNFNFKASSPVWKAPAKPAFPPKLDIEYGPRGGRFVRTSTGFRRYF